MGVFSRGYNSMLQISGEVTPICTTALATPATVHLDPYTKEGAESLHILIASKGKNVHTVNLKFPGQSCLHYILLNGGRNSR